MITWSQFVWASTGLAVSSSSTWALGAVALASDRKLLDMPWLAIMLTAALAAFGGVFATLLALHKAQASGADINIPLQVSMDFIVAIILGLVLWSLVAWNGWPELVLVGGAPFCGAAGQLLLMPMLTSVAKGAAGLVERVLGRIEK